ncbi:MAG: NYN domain-containing protein [Gammaproteobacteria bacterium]|nr:NYN domain-containing protein [Gammaproteobacteria bacterium]
MNVSKPKIGVFVDVQNIYYTTRDAFKRSFDYRQFWQYLSQQGELVVANAYAIASNNDGQRKFQDALRHIGFEVKLKPFIQRSDGSAKGDWDVGITIDIMEAASDLDVVVLLSGDGDFELLMNKIKQKHQLTTKVYGVESLTANNLIQSVDEFIAIPSHLLM